MDLTSLASFVDAHQSVIISIISSIFTSVVAAKITAKSEQLKALKTKRIEAYDELIDLLDDYRQFPMSALDDSFYTRAVKLSNHLRAYGSLNVVDKMGNFITELHPDYRKCSKEIDELYQKQSGTVTYVGSPDEEPEIVPILNEPIDALEAKADKIKASYCKSDHEALLLVEPVLREVHKSVSRGGDDWLISPRHAYRSACKAIKKAFKKLKWCS